MKNRYETVFILTPVLSEEQAKEAVQKVKDLLVKGEAKFHLEENWGLKKLAYPVQKKTTGFFNLFEYEAEGTLIDTLETSFRRDERVLRFLTIKLDKHAIKYNEGKKAKKAAKSVA